MHGCSVIVAHQLQWDRMWYYRPICLVLVLIIGGVYWRAVIIKRLPNDIDELRNSDESPRRIAIIVVWILTVPVLVVTLILSLSFLSKCWDVM